MRESGYFCRERWIQRSSSGTQNETFGVGRDYIIRVLRGKGFDIVDANRPSMGIRFVVKIGLGHITLTHGYAWICFESFREHQTHIGSMTQPTSLVGIQLPQETEFISPFLFG
ncbi:hypothetical protein AA313_de0209265 [Arthrobotrys entomopaga]|nr:hypothetical protein AA313_de0209265 [Arthrobotrys entomopaga]